MILDVMRTNKKLLSVAFVPLAVLFLAVTFLGDAAFAQSTSDTIREGVSDVGEGNADADLGVIIQTIINIILFLVGVVAVIMIIIGGFRYVVSGGDSSATKAAKDTIMYAVIGIIVALIAFAIVNFVLNAFIDV